MATVSLLMTRLTAMEKISFCFLFLSVLIHFVTLSLIE